MAPEATHTAAGTGLQRSKDAPVSVLKEVPVTEAFQPAQDLDKYITNPSQPRANRAVSKEHPHGETALSDKHTVLQQHVLFWDRDGDGIIWPTDTFVGFRRLGFNLLISTLAVPFIHGSFSYASQPHWIPDLRMPLHIKQIHRTKHGSDTDTYDTEGRFQPQKFEDIFSKFDRGNKGGLNWSDIMVMVRENMNIYDLTGWIAERLEWWATWVLLADENGLVTKEKIRGLYDGSIFPKIAAEVAEKKRRKAEGKNKKTE